jgi:hypothetical protein
VTAAPFAKTYALMKEIRRFLNKGSSYFTGRRRGQLPPQRHLRVKEGLDGISSRFIPALMLILVRSDICSAERRSSG